jgi:glucose-1-phosphate adenylyltransferase
VEVPLEHAGEFGIMETDDRGRVTCFEEKPPAPRPASPGATMALASMGIYVFGASFLTRCLARSEGVSGHDFGRHVLPALIPESRVYAYAFRDPSRGGPAYWRDVGTLDSYWCANMDLVADEPSMDLGDQTWPIWTHRAQRAPARFMSTGTASRSIVSSGCTIAGTVEHSVLSPGCSISAGARIESSVVLSDVIVGRHCLIRRAVIDNGCRIPDGLHLDSEMLGDGMHASPRPSAGIALITAELIERVVARAAQRPLAVANS